MPCPSSRQILRPYKPISEHTNQFGASPTITHSNTYVGLTAGAGIDLAITDMITGFVEYRYTVYGDESVGPRTVGAFNFASHDVEVAFHQIQAGISIHLGNWLGGGN